MAGNPTRREVGQLWLQASSHSKTEKWCVSAGVPEDPGQVNTGGPRDCRTTHGTSRRVLRAGAGGWGDERLCPGGEEYEKILPFIGRWDSDVAVPHGRTAATAAAIRVTRAA